VTRRTIFDLGCSKFLIVSTLGDSYLHASSHSAGGAAEIASVRKKQKYSLLLSNCQPIVGGRTVASALETAVNTVIPGNG